MNFGIKLGDFPSVMFTQCVEKLVVSRSRNVILEPKLDSNLKIVVDFAFRLVRFHLGNQPPMPNALAHYGAKLN